MRALHLQLLQGLENNITLAISSCLYLSPCEDMARGTIVEAEGPGSSPDTESDYILILEFPAPIAARNTFMIFMYDQHKWMRAVCVCVCKKAALIVSLPW